MRPLLTMSDERLSLINRIVGCTDRIEHEYVNELLAELDAQRAEPTREPGEAASAIALRDALRRFDAVLRAHSVPEGLLVAELTRWAAAVMKGAQVDAATIRRQVLDEAIASLPKDKRLPNTGPSWWQERPVGYNNALADMRTSLEALRDPADAREGK